MDYRGLSDSHLEDMAKLDALITIQDGFLSIYDNGHPYEISLKELETPERILHWAHHLCEKTWMSTDLLRVFIYKATKEAGLDIYKL